MISNNNSPYTLWLTGDLTNDALLGCLTLPLWNDPTYVLSNSDRSLLPDDQ